MSVTSTPAWQKLLAHRDIMRGQSMSDLFAADPARLDRYSIGLDGLRLNYAFQKASDETLALLVDLAAQQDIAGWRVRMFGGDKINATEGRAVLHTALRYAGGAPVRVDGVDVMPEIHLLQTRISDFVDHVRSGAWKGATGLPLRTIVNIGIGGSDLGPRMATEALHAYVTDLDVRFVANADAFEIDNVLKNIDPAQTLFVVVSKTFTTSETLLNARTARAWVAAKLGSEAVAKHFVAVSVNEQEVEKFGIPVANMFPMWDWVGGRFSVWSAVGLVLQLAIGTRNFADFLAGAAAMDAHFQTAPLASNMPVMLAMLGIWNRNFLEAPALAVLPYCERLRDFPRYLQQLEMESNGKRVTREGRAVGCETAPVLFGECGTVGQHSFHQWLHQGTTSIPADFVAIATDDLGEPEHQRVVLSNLVAQIGALAFGQTVAASPHDVYPGGRSSNLILLDRLDPFCLGMLMALYEHKAFVQGIVWEINSFDQPGVELGKRLAKGVGIPVASDCQIDPAAALIDRFFRSIVQKL